MQRINIILNSIDWSEFYPMGITTGLLEMMHKLLQRVINSVMVFFFK